MRMGRPTGIPTGQARTAQALRYMHEHGCSAVEAAHHVGIGSSSLSEALRSGRYDAQGNYIGTYAAASRSLQAAHYVKEQQCTLLEAGKRFGISRQAVEQGWKRAFPGEPVPTQLRRSLDQEIVRELIAQGRGCLEITLETRIPEHIVRAAARALELDLPAGAHRTEKTVAVEAALADVLAGSTVVDAAAAHSVSVGNLSRLMRGRGVTSQWKFQNSVTRWGRSEQAAALVLQGMPVQQAAAQACVAPNALRAYCRRNGITLPSSSARGESKGARASALVAGGMSPQEACIEVGCSIGTLYGWWSRHGRSG